MSDTASAGTALALEALGVTPERLTWEPIEAGARSYGLPLAPVQVGQLQEFRALLCEWNRRMNLTAIERPEDVLVKHFLDSLTCGLVVDLPAARSLLDVGTGAGFPGLVLKIAAPRVEVTLLDSLRKRLDFLDRVIASLALTGVYTVHARAEDAGHDPGHRERYDVVVARAVAPLNVLAEWTLPFARVGGCVVAMKGPQPEVEAADAAGAVRSLGGRMGVVRELRLPLVDAGRSLVRLEKVRPSPAVYPRPPGSARRRPL